MIRASSEYISYKMTLGSKKYYKANNIIAFI
jgi:hypothetical protein